MEDEKGHSVDIRHLLAVERTIYANERTFLAYLRTSLTLIITGLSFLEFTSSPFLVYIAWFFILCGIFILLFGGIVSYFRKVRIKKEKDLLNLSLSIM